MTQTTTELLQELRRRADRTKGDDIAYEAWSMLDIGLDFIESNGPPLNEAQIAAKEATR